MRCSYDFHEITLGKAMNPYTNILKLAFAVTSAATLNNSPVFSQPKPAQQTNLPAGGGISLSHEAKSSVKPKSLAISQTDEVLQVVLPEEQVARLTSKRSTLPYQRLQNAILLNRVVGMKKREAREKDEAAEVTQEKIIGGTPAANGAFPFQVALLQIKQINKTKFAILGQFCAGTLLNDRWVLTAAHCFVQGENGQISSITDPRNIGAHLGNNDLSGAGDKILVKRIIPHPKYVTGTSVNDIALVELERTPNAPNIEQVTIASKADENSLIPVGADLTIIGWGTTETGKGSAKLLQGEIKAVDQTLCNRSLTTARLQSPEIRKSVNSLAYEFNLTPAARKTFELSISQAGGTVTPQMFCAAAQSNGQDNCSGDSGGPILSKDSAGKFVQVGIVSFGVGECGEAGLPGVYTRVGLYADWIVETVTKFRSN